MFNAQNAVTVTSSLSRTEKDIVYYNSGTIEKFWKPFEKLVQVWGYILSLVIFKVHVLVFFFFFKPKQQHYESPLKQLYVKL